MTGRRWLLVALAVIGVGAAVVGVTLAATTDHGKLVYTVTSLSHGRVKATLTDGRDGDHTSWIVLHDAPSGGDRRLLNLFNRGDAPDVEWVSTSSRVRLPAGDYRYGVYSTDRLYAPDDPKYWTAEYLVAEGEVTVP